MEVDHEGEDLEQGTSLLNAGNPNADPDRNRYAGFLGFLLSKVETPITRDDIEVAQEIRNLVGGMHAFFQQSRHSTHQGGISFRG